MNNLPKLCMA